jgi:hypothetical protein
MASQKFALAEVLDHITDEIRKAHARSADQGGPVMQFEECEFEFAIEAEKEASGGLKVWIINLGGGAKRTDSNTIRVKYTKIPGRPYQAEQQQGEGAGPEI